MIDPNKHYSLGMLAREEAIPNITPNPIQYIKFIGSQATRGNALVRDHGEAAVRGEHPFKGSDVLNFINNIK